MKLYGYWRSSATYRVRIILALKGISYAYEPVNLLDGDQNADSYAEMNPQRLVPTLETDSGAQLSQSLAIAEYLEETKPDPTILAGDAIDRARARSIAAAVACEAQPYLNLRIQKLLQSDFALSDDALTRWRTQTAGATMAAVEAMLKASPGPFSVGADPGLADAFVIPQIYAARRFGVDVEAFERLREVENASASHGAFIEAHPENQPDAPAAS